MRLRSRHTILSLAFLGLSGAFAFSQAPVQPLEIVQPPKTDPKLDKKDEKKDDKEKKKAPPPVVPDRPPVTLPATTNPLGVGATAAAGASIAVAPMAPVYGDQQFGTMYYPYLQATLPNGRMQSVLPGQTATFPIGTTFNQNVPTQIVRVQTGTTTIPPGEQGNDFPITVPVYENRVQVVGTAAQASVGGLPLNVIRGPLKIGENESPRPQDRIYVAYNFFYDVNPTLSVAGLPITNVHRETLGVEKTFLDGNASVGLRVPLLQVSGAQNIQRQSAGDLSLIFKYALINEIIQDPDGSLRPGNLLSTGLVVTAPTGQTAAYTSDFPVVHSTVIQPWIGAIYVRGNLFLQGFTSVAVPTDSSDTTFFFNSLQIGYQAYTAPMGSFVNSVSPIFEVHVNTPLNNRGITRLPVGSFDVVSVTGGVTVGLGSRSYLNIGTNTPLSGPKPYGIEAIAQLNFYY